MVDGLMGTFFSGAILTTRLAKLNRVSKRRARLAAGSFSRRLGLNPDLPGVGAPSESPVRHEEESMAAEPLRMDLSKIAPDAYRHFLQLEGLVTQHVERKLLHLLKLRASQINGCAY